MLCNNFTDAIAEFHIMVLWFSYGLFVGIYAKEIRFASCIILRRIGDVRKFII